MARPLRIEYPGAYYHITARGNRREDIFLNDADRVNWLELFGKVCKRFNWVCHGYCLMTNHYHLIVETVDGGLSTGMRQLNGVYTQTFNRIHDSVGHLFQGRYKSILVDKDSYLLELNRYVVLNPVRAGLVVDPGDWRWSSYSTVVGKVSSPVWLNSSLILAFFHPGEQQAQMRYQNFVRDGIGSESPLKKISHQTFLGDDDFIAAHQAMYDHDGDIDEIPQSHRRSARKPLSYFAETADEPKEAMAKAYLSGHYTMKQIGLFFGVHYATVSRAVKKFVD